MRIRQLGYLRLCSVSSVKDFLDHRDDIVNEHGEAPHSYYVLLRDVSVGPVRDEQPSRPSRRALLGIDGLVPYRGDVMLDVADETGAVQVALPRLRSYLPPYGSVRSGPAAKEFALLKYRRSDNRLSLVNAL